MEDLKCFIKSAPSQLSNSNDLIIKQRLETGETINCIKYNYNDYLITGTDIVKTIKYRLERFGRRVINNKKFEEGIFSDLRNLKLNVHCLIESPRSNLLEFLYRNNCVRTQKKQKLFFWLYVPHDKLFMDCLKREFKKESNNVHGCTEKIDNNIDNEFLNLDSCLVMDSASQLEFENHYQSSTKLKYKRKYNTLSNLQNLRKSFKKPLSSNFNNQFYTSVVPETSQFSTNIIPQNTQFGYDNSFLLNSSMNQNYTQPNLYYNSISMPNTNVIQNNPTFYSPLMENPYNCFLAQQPPTLNNNIANGVEVMDYNNFTDKPEYKETDLYNINNETTQQTNPISHYNIFEYDSSNPNIDEYGNMISHTSVPSSTINNKQQQNMFEPVLSNDFSLN